MSDIPTGEVIERAVRLAGRAPSLHNSQPWRWEFDGTTLRLFSVPARLLPATDTAGRQMLLSCGVALGHLRAALAADGWRIRVAYFPNPTRRDHLANVTFEPAAVISDADRDRAQAIEHRHTDRLPFETPPGWAEFDTVLRTVVDPADATLTVLPDSTRPELARASRLTATLRRYDSSYQAELHWWTGHSFVSAGIPAAALITAEERERVDIGRSLPTVVGSPRRPELGVDRSRILVLSTDRDTPEGLVRCGVALSNVLLESTAAGYATCPLTHITEVPRSRAIVRTLTGLDAQPQVMVRIGAAGPGGENPAPTPRLPLAEILRTVPPPARW
ncbi:nitroreductase family protein [Nocardia sp. CDC153]|uniref:Acg family FMN-binding oxidoreductase n=1 Tax=Nocardia sp. CDC153 TaxID=3112167 RepID=UPI002DB9A621|nr:nitroreductase family protein [Nocardia sp. CDC153]MEC3957917.1 nitroreductase family protein [Nocardia sp. CDC153]